MLNTAIIGVSGYGETHYNNLMRYYRRGLLNIVGATVINQTQELEKCTELKSIGCRIFDDYRAMFDALKGQIDLCFIPTGINMHAPMAIAAMQAGADAFIEKPAAAVIQDIIAMKAAEKRYGRRVWVGFQICCQPEVRRILEISHSPEFGRLKRVRGIGIAGRSQAYYQRNRWAGKYASNGEWILDSPMNNAYAHYLHLALLFSGNLKWVEAQLFRANPMLECADNACIRAMSKDGIECLFYTSHTPESANRLLIELEGENGLIQWTMNETTYQINGQVEKIKNICGLELQDIMMDALLANCSGGYEFCCDLDMAAVHTRTVNAAHESCPVIETPWPEVTQSTKDGQSYFGIRGIDREYTAAFNEWRMLSLPWLTTPERIQLDDYDLFHGLKLKQDKKENSACTKAS